MIFYITEPNLLFHFHNYQFTKKYFHPLYNNELTILQICKCVVKLKDIHDRSLMVYVTYVMSSSTRKPNLLQSECQSK